MNMLRQNSLVVYTLKHQYGVSASLYRRISSTYDVAAGSSEHIYASLNVRKFIILPENSQLGTYYTGPFYQAGRAFTYGAEFDEKSRTAIVDAKDLRGNIIETTDYIIYDDARYNIKTAVTVTELRAQLLHISYLGPATRPSTLVDPITPDPDTPASGQPITFETIAQNLGSLDIVNTVLTDDYLIKDYNTGWGTSIRLTMLFDSEGLPTTKTLTGDGVPIDIDNVCTYDFSGGRTVPLKTYSRA